MMLPKIIFIAIENFNRELSGKILLANDLSANGYCVFIGHKSIIRSMVLLYPLKNQIFIDKGVVNGSGERIKKLKKKGMHIFSFDEEALMQTDDVIYSRNNHESDSKKYIDGVFSWGPRHTNLLKNLGYKDEQIIKTGNPRFDQYKLNDKNEKKIKTKRKYILICSRFCKQRSARMLDGSEKYMDGFNSVFKRFLNIPKIIREADINLPIFIRPHPSEDFQPWHENTRNLENVKISSKGPVANNFDDALIMIHNRCTTGIEAYLSNIPVISYEPVKLDEPPHPPSKLLEAFSTFVAHDDQNLVAIIKNIKFSNNSNNRAKSIKQFLYNSKNYSFKSITQFLNSKFPASINGANFLNIILLFVASIFLYCFHSLLKFILYFSNNDLYRYSKKKTGTNFIKNKNLNLERKKYFLVLPNLIFIYPKNKHF